MTECENRKLSQRLLERSLRAWVGFVEQRPVAVLVVAGVLAIASIVYSALNLGFKTSRDDLVHPSEAYFQDWKRYESEFGGEMDIIIAVEGSDRSRMVAALETIAQDLTAHPKSFEKLFHRVKTDKLREKGLFQLPLAELTAIQSRLEPLKPLLIGGWSWMSLENVLRAARFRLSHIPADKPLDENSRQLFQSATRLLVSLEQYLSDPRVYHSPWKDLLATSGRSTREIPEYLFSPNGRLAWLSVAPVRDPAQFTGVAEPVAIARNIVQRVAPHFPELSFGVTGMPVLEADEMTAAMSTGGGALGISLLGVVILFVVGFRALRHPAYAVITILVCFAWTIGWTTLTVGHLNIISASFISTLIGLGDDYWILWLSRYEADRANGASVRCANVEVANAVGPCIVVGAFTTATAFFCTMSTGFLGLREMGWITGSGMILFAFGVLTVLPALLVVGGRQRISVDRAKWDSHEAFKPISRRPVMTLAVGGAVVAALACFAPRVRFDYNLLNLQAHGTPAVEWEKKLLKESGSSGWYALSVADSPDEARALKEKFERLPTVGKVVEVASLLPADQGQKAPLIARIHDSLLKLPKMEQLPELALPRADQLDAVLGEFSAAQLAPLPATDRMLVDRLVSAAAPAKIALDRLAPSEQTRLLADYERRWAKDLLSLLRELRDVSNPEPVTVADLPSVLRERYVGPHGKWLVQIFARESAWDYEPLKAFCDSIATVDPRVTGKPISTLWSLTQMTSGYVRSTYWASLFVFGLVWLDLRRIRDVLLASVPLALGATAMVGLMGYFGVSLNVANMIALPLILGIGIDMGVHVLHDFHESRGEYRLNWRLARAMSMTGATTVIGFAALTSAQHWGIISAGLVISTGVAACTLSAIFLLPAILKIITRAAPASVVDIDALAPTVSFHKAA